MLAYAADCAEKFSKLTTSSFDRDNSPARMTPSAWLALRAPTMAPVTAGLLQSPGNCDFARRATVAFADFEQRVRPKPGSSTAWAQLKFAIAAAPVVLRQAGGAFSAHGSGQQA